MINFVYGARLPDRFIGTQHQFSFTWSAGLLWDCGLNPNMCYRLYLSWDFHMCSADCVAVEGKVAEKVNAFETMDKQGLSNIHPWSSHTHTPTHLFEHFHSDPSSSVVTELPSREWGLGSRLLVGNEARNGIWTDVCVFFSPNITCFLLYIIVLVMFPCVRLRPCVTPPCFCIYIHECLGFSVYVSLCVIVSLHVFICVLCGRVCAHACVCLSKWIRQMM